MLNPVYTVTKTISFAKNNRTMTNNKKFSLLRILMAGAVAVSVSPVFAASDNGCDNPENDYVQSDYALCSTHPYNVGMVEIPDANGRAIMREVVAMKSELITQQMYQNYRALESMLNRLEKQLEKAVIKAQTDSASSGKSSSSDDVNGGGRGYNPGNRGTPLATANDCSMKTSKSEIISCLQSNIQIIRNEINSGNTVNARKQIDADLKVAVTNRIINGSANDPKMINITDWATCGTDKDGTSMSNCKEVLKAKKRQTDLDCLNEFSSALSAAIELQECRDNLSGGRGRY